jgi:CRISPR-associated endonuclease/helicase Cas3
MLFAHSPDPKRGIPAQDYAAHVGGVVGRACEAADGAAKYASCDGETLKKVVRLAAEYHDLGKLDGENQEVLSGKLKARKLPVQHTDAGAAYLLDTLLVTPGAALVRSHHIGLPDFVEEQNRDEESVLRDDDVRERVNDSLPELFKLHDEASKLGQGMDAACCDITGDSPLFFRIALSCLADGDHTDTAIHYGDQAPYEPVIPLRPAARLAALDLYVGALKEDSDRSRLRSEVYGACRDADAETQIASCDSPVGTGKTTAVMAHLLAQADKRHLRRVIVVLPFTNIIKQSVDTYRKALALPGEDPEYVVAELHHRADFQDIQSRQFTALWKAPIVVTTAVAFFETLASNTPATLRRLHNVPGSAVFIDESHGALPAKLLPLAWRWVKGLAREWGCYWVMASGSLNRFWEIEEFDKEASKVSNIMPASLRVRLAEAEKGRIIYRSQEAPFGGREIVEWVASLPGPRIVILNTVQSAASVAREYAKRFQRSSVEHLSTALTPFDRDTTLDRIKSRLTDTNDADWTLIATSCVEAGVDLSFKSGVREAASLVSLLQTAGRVNRHSYVNTETVWTVTLKEEDLLRRHPGMADSSRVLLDLISEGHVISPDLCTDALKREIRLAGSFSDSLLRLDQGLRFPQVERDFRVIASDTRTVVVEGELIERLEKHVPVGWRDVQKASVQIWGYRLNDLRIPEVLGHPGIYKWPYAYDAFIGYMAGLLSVEAVVRGIGGACVI